MKRKLIIALVACGIIATGVIFWKVLAALMWMAYYAGIPM